MQIFKPKPGDILTTSRFLHLFEAAFFTAISFMAGYEIGAFALFIIIAIGFVWELSNKFVVPGQHRFGDAWDLMFFIYGVVIGGTASLIIISLK